MTCACVSVQVLPPIGSPHKGRKEGKKEGKSGRESDRALQRKSSANLSNWEKITTGIGRFSAVLFLFLLLFFAFFLVRLTVAFVLFFLTLISWNVLGERLNCILSRLFLVAKFVCACPIPLWPFPHCPLPICELPSESQRIGIVLISGESSHQVINSQAWIEQLQALQGQRPRQKHNAYIQSAHRKKRRNTTLRIYIYLHIYSHKWS